uniref:Cytochrome b n=1 Tax=Goeldia sp. DPP-2018 TaxID=2136113 RepID=A0A2U8XDS9_9ARAC|nr:cytochrome b [Goeldia sp. DPP-2018]
MLVFRKSEKLLSLVGDSFLDLPSPSSLSYLWNFGSLLGLFLMFQVLSGLFLAFHFTGDVNLSFDSVVHLMRDVGSGWVLRSFHANGASMFFLLMYIHIGRGLYYGSYSFKSVWMSGVTILLLSMATAFLGYVLPWGQMSFWAATVITNLLSAVPYVGKIMVEWLWGGFAVGNPTLTRFFAFHFILPFMIMIIVVLHLVFLHESGSNNPVGLMMDGDSVMFHPYFVLKDMFGYLFFLSFYFYICLMMPYMFMDVENFILANPLVTPVHIQPEWYFLFAYSILRSIPSKIGGVVALVMSVMVLYVIPILGKFRFRGITMYMMVSILFWVYVFNWMLLTWIGACEVEYPFSEMGAYFSFIYFFLYFFMWMLMKFQDSIVVWL